jgi:hypothetical protein
MKFDQSYYPDISDILQRKAEGRREIAARSFEQKLQMLEAMRNRVAPLREARERRRAEQLVRVSA